MSSSSYSPLHPHRQDRGGDIEMNGHHSGNGIFEHVPDTPSSPMNVSSSSEVWAREIFEVKKASSVDSSKQSKFNLSSKTTRLGRASFALLIVLGISAGLVNGLLVWLNGQVSQLQAWILTSHGYYSIGFLYYIISTVGFVSVASCLCKYVAPKAAGSGLPEFKSLLASDLSNNEPSKLVPTTVLLPKIIGLVCTAGAGLSCGIEGPLVHIAACIAHVLMKYIHDFQYVLDSPSIAKQIFAASAAVGISSSFNAPVGGMLFSVETTATFYLISNYWKSCIAAASGAVACYYIITPKDQDPMILLEMDNDDDSVKHLFSKWELIVFFFISVLLGFLSIVYLHVNQLLNEFLKPYCQKHPLALCASVAFVTAVLIYITGAYDSHSVGVMHLVSDVLGSGSIAEMRRFDGIHPLGGLVVSFLIRCLLTLLATNIPVPAGIFMPVLYIGGIFGRFVGTLVAILSAGSDISVHIPSYALVGCVAFASGITQTVSVAVIAIEMTGDIKMLLPCLVAAVTAAGISRTFILSAYDQGMVNKGIENFQLLMSEASGIRHASELMDASVLSIPNPCSILDAVKILEATDQSIFPLVDSESPEGQHGKLLGSLSRRNVFLYLKRSFVRQGLEQILRSVLVSDFRDDDELITKAAAREAKIKQREKILANIKERISRTEAMAENFLFPEHNAHFATKGHRSKKHYLKEKADGKISNRNNVNRALDLEVDMDMDMDMDGEEHKPSMSPRVTFLTEDDGYEAITPVKVTLPLSPVEHLESPNDKETDFDKPLTLEFSPEERKEEQKEKEEETAGMPFDCRGSKHSDEVRPTTAMDSQLFQLMQQHQFQFRNNLSKSFHSVIGAFRDEQFGGDGDEDVVDSRRGGNVHRINEVVQQATAQLQSLLVQSVDFMAHPRIRVHLYPFSASQDTPIEHVYILFEMVKASSIFVVEDGQLIGMISRDRLIENLRSKRLKET